MIFYNNEIKEELSYLITQSEMSQLIKTMVPNFPYMLNRGKTTALALDMPCSDVLKWHICLAQEWSSLQSFLQKALPHVIWTSGALRRSKACSLLHSVFDRVQFLFHLSTFNAIRSRSVAPSSCHGSSSCGSCSLPLLSIPAFDAAQDSTLLFFLSNALFSSYFPFFWCLWTVV